MKKDISKGLPKLLFSKESLLKIKTPALVLGLFEGEKEMSRRIGEIDKAIDKKITSVIESGDFKGKTGEVLTLYIGDTNGKIRSERIILSGLGKKKEIDLDTLRAGAASAAKKARSLGISSIALPYDFETGWEGDISDCTEAVFVGASLGSYDYDQLKKNDESKKKIENIVIIGEGDEIENAARRGRIISDSVYLARDLSNAPSNLMTPRILARKAKELARRYQLICDVFAEKDIKKMKMGAFLGVSKGSTQSPVMIVMEYMPKEKKPPAVALVGKGITFDTGGISLKPSNKMEEMKSDMSGAAAVMGTVLAAARLKLSTGVVGVIPATENMPSGSAMKPGDVVTAMNGTTIEVINTDAEGRLILADAITFAKKYKPAAIVDIATLTGAAVIALGGRVSALYATDDKLKENLREASRKTGEKVWPMPLFDHYAEQLKSDVADVKNVGGREAGSITAATFLKKFTDEKCPWAHIDIAGTARSDSDYDWVRKGATGYGVMLLVKFLEMI